ncbi:hypothetical protein K502DRAFT_53049 [Neoconidiobolus thromboides FSU 785]|nr:hypothetical protein K502DRAFT_53049 [Neoconidiobolus thromboides FSU 785]
MLKRWINYMKIKGWNPFNKRQLIGRDLEGNNYYEEERDGFPRRTVELAQKQLHLGQISSADLAVQWRSWLRHTRRDPPSIEELEAYEIQKNRTIERAKVLELEWQKKKLLISNKVEQANKPKIKDNESKVVNPNKSNDGFQPDSWSPVSQRN